MNLTKLEFKKIFTPLTVIAVVVMLLLNLYMTFDYRAAYLLAALDPDSKSKPIETLKSEYAEKRGEITDEWIAARRSDVENILNDPKYLKTEDELKQYLSDLATQGYPAEEIERLKSQPYTILNNNGITVILLKLYHLSVRILILKIQDVGNIRTSEFVYGLIIITHYTKVLVLGSQKLHQQKLSVVGILILIHHYVLETFHGQYP